MDKSNLEPVNDTNQSTPRRRARRLINLSLHDAPPELHAIGVIDPWSEPSAAMKAFYATSRGNYNNKRKDLVNAIHSGNWKGYHDWCSLFRRDMINDAYQRSSRYSRYYLEKLPRIAKAQDALYAWVEEEFEFLPELLSALEASEITPVFLRKKETSQAGEPSCATELSAYTFVEARAPHKVVEGPFDVNVSNDVVSQDTSAFRDLFESFEEDVLDGVVSRDTSTFRDLFESFEEEVLDGVDFPEGAEFDEGLKVFDDSFKLIPHPERCWVDIEEENKLLGLSQKEEEE